MKKHTLAIRCPISTRSGYGVWARQLVYSIIKSPLYENFNFYIMPCSWGDTPHNALDEDNEMNNEIKRVLNRVPLDVFPDIFMTMTIPHEFQRYGKKVNIGITAACESDRISPRWINDINNMDITYAISRWTAHVIFNTFYQEKNMQTGEVINVSKVTKPIGVWFPAVDTNIFHPGIRCKIKDLNITTPKNFLFVGHWLKGGYGMDRKNVGVLIRTYLQTFLGVDDVGLILKVSGAHTSLLDREDIKKKIEVIKGMVHNPENKKLPKMYLLHGDITDSEMTQLYNHPSILSYVSAHHGEGWGYPIIESMACNVPSILVPWSGTVDFLKKDHFLPVPFDVVEIPDQCLWENVFVKGAKWANVKDDMLSKAMVWSYQNPVELKKIGIKNGQYIRDNFAMDILQVHTNRILEHTLNAVEGRFDTEHLPFKEL